jgi:hypothetical protein
MKHGEHIRRLTQDSKFMNAAGATTCKLNKMERAGWAGRQPLDQCSTWYRVAMIHVRGSITG